jgi:hypothetical protein
VSFRQFIGGGGIKGYIFRWSKTRFLAHFHENVATFRAGFSGGQVTPQVKSEGAKFQGETFSPKGVKQRKISPLTDEKLSSDNFLQNFAPLG